MAAAIKVFLSYARDDDEKFADRLSADLISSGFEVWRDRSSMPSRGRTFLHEIRAAIEASQRFLLVVGPAAKTSDYVAAEWQHAIAYGLAITPVLRLGDISIVPEDLRTLDVADFRQDSCYALHFQKLVGQLAETVAPMGKLVGIPSLPQPLLTRAN